MQIGEIKDPVERYFAYARERQNIYLRKERGEPRPWTDDPILHTYKFTSVFREQDRTTKVVKRVVRDPYNGKPEGLLANVAARWFNRPEVIEFLFDGVFQEYIERNRIEVVENELRKQFTGKPIVTGAYLITSPAGYSKLEGICHNIHTFRNGRFPATKGDDYLYSWQDIAYLFLDGNDRSEVGMEELWEFLQQVPYQGTFHSHENVVDLRHTKMLDNAYDKNTWTNPGPGCQRGLSQIHGRPWMSEVPRKQAIQELIQLLNYSRDPNLWPAEWQPWELHQAEMWSCEFFKIEKVRLGLGRPRSIYK